MPQGGTMSEENSSQHPVSLRSPRLCGLFSGQILWQKVRCRFLCIVGLDGFL